ncbi:hypothetical protein VPNG_07651 [Cytospora leucostoma]|uniref:Complex 1 LYR protein domain-containing protein n=1 Tax=Cytospora leucostoma TaxID=1230097 RepID=A0A423WF42_9PEZI|nr:hypothetical protein VPNG_07651 [Cytospora leucostoma]
MARLSGLQREVLGLYRQCLRESRTKPEATRKHFEAFARAEFQKNVAIEKRDFAAIDPHRRPNVKFARTTSTKPSALQLPQPKNPSTKAAQEVLNKPLSPPISRLRRAQQALIGRRRRVSNRNGRVRVSFAHSSSSAGLHPFGTRNSLYVQKQSSKDGSRIDQVTNWTGGLDTPRRRDADPYPPMARPVAPPKDDVRRENKPQSSAVQPVRPAADGGDLKYSLMQVPEGPGYHVSTPKGHAEYAHVASLDGSSDRKNCRKASKPRARRNGSYVARAPPSYRRTSTRPVKRVRDLRKHGDKASTKATQDKPHAILDPLIEESLERSLSQQNRLSCLMTPPRMKSRPNPASPPSRAPSQQRSLTRFTKELERYCMAVSANGKAPLPLSTPTVSDSPTTLDTVTELLPYHRQFRAAGLAVTSREQMPGIPESPFQQLPVMENMRGKNLPVARLQFDGNTVTPSEVESIAGDAAGPSVPRKDDGPPTAATEPQASSQQAKPINKSVLPWMRNKDTAVAHKAHSGRRISIDHLHPSQAMAAQPFLTPSDKLGIIDSYFDSPSPSKTLGKQPETPKVSISPPSSSNVSSLLDKPLPKKPSTEHPRTEFTPIKPTECPPIDRPQVRLPQVERRPIPQRSGRRHMENTSQWPTARVLIHDDPPAAPELHTEEEVEDLAEVINSFPLPQRDTNNSRSSSSPAAIVTEGTIKHSIPSQAGITKTMDAEDRPATPPRNESDQQPLYKADSHHHRSQSLCKQWSRVTVMRRSRGRQPPVSTTIQEEPKASPIKQKPATTSNQKKENLNALKTSHNQAQAQSMSSGSGSTTHTSEETPDSLPQLPYTWKFAVESSSSFEKALDAVIQKLDDMEERRQWISIDYFDNDIPDRDILLGLKMAICAACDQDLDAWIREKTGLRLRRFLADLKAFDAVTTQRKPPAPTPAPQPLHRQIRRNNNEARRLRAERERRGQSLKKTLLPCFGADGAPAGPG